ncbi:MAG: hypothetical protein ACM3PY_16355, partial [Omnitrophica WOR_2 bacterium]
MATNFLEYPLEEGYIHNWLIAGPQSTPIPELNDLQGEMLERKTQISRSYSEPDYPLNAPPVDGDTFKKKGDKFTWNYFRCHEDHFVDVSDTYPTWQHLRTWAYTQVRSRGSYPVTFILTSLGPVDVWLNSKKIFHQDNYYEDLQSFRFEAKLDPVSVILVSFDQVAAGECTNVFALQMSGLPAREAGTDIKVHIPTNARYPLRQQLLELAFEKAYLEEVVNYRGAHFNLRWSEELNEEISFNYQVQDSEERIYVEGTWRSNTTEGLDIGHTVRLFERPYTVTLRAPMREYYHQGLHYQRKMPLYVLDNAYAATPTGNIGQRRKEALEDAAKRDGSFFAEIAKMELGSWDKLDLKTIRQAIERINRRETGSPSLLTGLLGMQYRYSGNEAFPKEISLPIEDCILNYKYWPDEPGGGALEAGTESQAILLHACGVLAGQRYPDQTFSNSSLTGSQQREKHERLALDWIRQRSREGFSDWNSNCYFEQDLSALSHLTSLAENETLCELSAVLMDKMLFLMAVNSYQGAFGCTHGRTRPSMIKSAQLDATSGIFRMLFGIGVYNPHTMGQVNLACSNYEFPSFLAELAASLPDEMLDKECARFYPAGATVGAPPPGEVNTVTYKTPDYLLSSAQDYCPGAKGKQEHIWQATMGTEAVVFTNHPACMSESEAHLPGFWLGNAVLPRVAQWKDTLIAVYNLPENDWMGFTHAYFPIYAFDEHTF